MTGTTTEPQGDADGDVMGVGRGAEHYDQGCRDERDRIVAWLRRFSPAVGRKLPEEFADAIERGEHRG
jgi:hypothetical protein